MGNCYDKVDEFNSNIYIFRLCQHLIFNTCIIVLFWHMLVLSLLFTSWLISSPSQTPLVNHGSELQQIKRLEKRAANVPHVIPRPQLTLQYRTSQPTVLHKFTWAKPSLPSTTKKITQVHLFCVILTALSFRPDSSKYC